MASRQFEQVGHQTLRDPRLSPPQLQTQGLNPHSRFSYMETPAQFSNAHFEQFSSPTNSTIDESPTSAVTQQWTVQHDGQRRSPYPEEKAPPSRSTSPYNFPPPQGLHPALSAPYANTESPIQPRSPSYQMSMLSPRPYSPSHAQAKKPADFKPPQRTLNTAPDPDPIKESRLNPLTKALTYNPNSPVGPNVTSETHRPGQASHPNSAVEPEWKHGLCEVDMTCCMGLFCPCMLYSKTQYRLSQKSRRREATDLLGYENCNGPCTLMALACGFQWVLATVQHTRIRKMYHLNSSFKSDCLKSFCCCCCVLMQDEREVRDREESLRRHAGPAASVPYTSPVSMAYDPPPR